MMTRAWIAHTHDMKPACRAVGTPKTEKNLAVEHLLTARKDKENLPLHVLNVPFPSRLWALGPSTPLGSARTASSGASANDQMPQNNLDVGWQLRNTSPMTGPVHLLLASWW